MQWDVKILPAAKRDIKNLPMEQRAIAVEAITILGRHPRSRQSKKLQGEAAAGSEDLLNRISVETLMQGGRVYVVQPDQVPLEGSAAALFRF